MPLAAFPFNCPPTADPYCYMSYATQYPQTYEAFYALMYDATGKPAPNPHTGQEAFTMDLRNAGPGISFIRIRSADGRLDVTRSILLE